MDVQQPTHNRSSRAALDEGLIPTRHTGKDLRSLVLPAAWAWTASSFKLGTDSRQLALAPALPDSSIRSQKAASTDKKVSVTACLISAAHACPSAAAHSSAVVSSPID